MASLCNEVTKEALVDNQGTVNVWAQNLSLRSLFLISGFTTGFKCNWGMERKIFAFLAH